ncbi:MAG: GvpL/GvpF family gas vesicle protein [Planctomycetota bacterium]|nr:GvpL/GvpF family gas vesicle protein [Planctomycetota bacterium]
MPEATPAGPGQTPETAAIYLFCFAERGAVPAIEGPSLDDSYRVMQLTVEDLAAVVSPVAVEQWTGPEAEARLQDISWVGPRACRHEQVVELVMRQSPVLPVRFGTMFSSRGSLETFVKKHRNIIQQFLDQVADKDEWAVKGALDRPALKSKLLATLTAAESPPLDSLPNGLRYLRESKIRAIADKEVNLWLKQWREKMASGLIPCASDLRELRARRCLDTGDRRDIILNWAFLVPRTSTANFHSKVQQCNTEYLDRGLSLETTGPWPPYSFCPSFPAES